MKRKKSSNPFILCQLEEPNDRVSNSRKIIRNFLLEMPGYCQIDALEAIMKATIDNNPILLNFTDEKKWQYCHDSIAFIGGPQKLRKAISIAFSKIGIEATAQQIIDWANNYCDRGRHSTKKSTQTFTSKAIECARKSAPPVMTPLAQFQPKPITLPQQKRCPRCGSGMTLAENTANTVWECRRCGYFKGN